VRKQYLIAEKFHTLTSAEDPGTGQWVYDFTISADRKRSQFRFHAICSVGTGLCFHRFRVKTGRRILPDFFLISDLLNIVTAAGCFSILALSAERLLSRLILLANVRACRKAPFFDIDGLSFANPPVCLPYLLKKTGNFFNG